MKKCGAKLMKAMSSAQMKKEAISKGWKIFGIILLVLGIILLFAAAANIFAGMSSGSSYSSMSSISAAGKCAVFGGLFTGLGIRFRKKK